MRRLSYFAPAILLLQSESIIAQATTPATAQSPSSKTAASKPAAKTTGTAAKPKTSTTKPATPMTPVPLTTDEQKTIYSLGLSIYRSISPFDLSPAELELVKRALSDAAANKPAVDITQYGPKIQPLAQARAAKVAQEQKAASAAYMAKAAAEPGAMKTDSGMIYKELRAGTGEFPKPTDTVKVNYRGTFINGTEFDSSYSRNEPTAFALNQVIKCWTEGVGKMKAGGKAMLVCPSDLAYGDQGRPGIPGGSTLVFEIELIGIGPG